MANETVITVCGVLGQDPELRFTPAGKPVANLSIASTPSRYDRNTSQWTDGTTMWMRASAWGEMAENVAESLRKGMWVIAQGRLVQRDYTTREGENRSVLQLEVDHIGPDLRRQRAQVTKQAPTGQQGGFAQQPAQPAAFGSGNVPAAAQDPWGTGGAQPSEPPF